MTSSGGGAGVQNAGNFSQQTGSTSTAEFEEWKTIMDVTLKENNMMIQKLKNELEEKSKAIDEIQSTSNITRKQNNLKVEKLQTGLDEKSKAVSDMEAKINENFEQLERKVNAELEKDDAEIGKLWNESTRHSERIDEHREDLEATIDEKFERLERKVNAELEKGDAEIEKLQNESIRHSKKIEENRKSFGGIYHWPRSSCRDASQSNVLSWDGKGGVVQISRGGKLYKVYCDVTTDGGGWTTFQKRNDGSIDFYRTWEEYADGFGNKLGEFWFGLENIYQLTQDGAYELRVDLTDWDGSTAYAKYGTFSISGRSDNYRLTVGQYSGTAGDSMTYHAGRPFSAKNKDLDGASYNCASMFGGAWWYDDCAHSSLNGRYNDTSDWHSGVYWFHWRGRHRYSLKGSEMKFRRK